MIGRRTLVKGAAAMMAAGTGGIAGRSNAQQPVPWSSGTERATLKAPANACDCHMHIYDSRFPAAPTAKLRPGDAHGEDYRKLQQRIGTTRTVVVTPSTYGTDNRCTLDALAKMGATARGVAVVDGSIADAELERLHQAGIRGIRFNLVQAGATSPDMLEPLSRRVNELGWHVQIYQTGERIAEMAALLRRLPSPIVFDHLGHVPMPEGVDHPSFHVIAGLLEQGRAWVKLSGAYIVSKTGAPAYADATKVAQAYVKLAPERLVWGSDWPHPTQTRKPDDAVLFDLLGVWAPDETVRRRILVDNPETLYGFLRAS